MKGGETEVVTTLPCKVRLRFIDLARAIAILLMLEGHFVGVVLADAYRDPSHPVYAVWSAVRRFSAPLFFTVSGMIVAYLLAGESDPNFLRRKRVRKGLRRAAELLLWGYALQLSLKHMGSYLALDFGSWIFAFHVLQCIGCGLLGVIGLAAARHRFGGPPTVLWYGAGMVLCLAAYQWMKHQPQGIWIPQEAPQIIQNTLRGPHSVFPLFPWLAFVFMGSSIGVALRCVAVRETLSTAHAILFAAALGMLILWSLAAHLPTSPDALGGVAWFAGRACEVLVFLGLLRWWEARRGIGLVRLLRMGSFTFEIYIIHVIILYGGLFGLGLNNVLAKRLDPIGAAMGAAIFLLAFYVLAQVIHAWKHRSSSS